MKYYVNFKFNMKHNLDQEKSARLIRVMIATGINPFTGRRLRGGMTEIAKSLRISTFLARKWGLARQQESAQETVENEIIVREN
jgi:hypothetical protein